MSMRDRTIRHPASTMEDENRIFYHRSSRLPPAYATGKCNRHWPALLTPRIALVIRPDREHDTPLVGSRGRRISWRKCGRVAGLSGYVFEPGAVLDDRSGHLAPLVPAAHGAGSPGGGDLRMPIITANSVIASHPQLNLGQIPLHDCESPNPRTSDRASVWNPDGLSNAVESTTWAQPRRRMQEKAASRGRRHGPRASCCGG